MKFKKITILGLFLCVALLIGYLENLIPFSVGIPGIKLGLANCVLLLILECIGIREAFLFAVIRVFLSGFLFGNFSSIIYSMAGSLFAIIMMMLCRKAKCFSLVGISIAGAVAHNIAQLVVAFFVFRSKVIWYYSPYLLLAGCAAGFFVGHLTKLLLPILRKIGINRV